MTSISLAPAALGFADRVHRTVLPNGLTVLICRDASAPVVAIVTYVKAGYFDETDDIVGIAHVLEHMFFKGTDRRGVGEIARATKASGGYLNAHTIYDHTSYYTVLPSDSFARGLDIQADAYARSVIDADELAKELEVIIQEAKRKTDNPPALATETLYELLHDTHRIRRWRIGTEAGLRTLGRSALMRFYRGFYRPGNTVLAIAGDVDPDRALGEVERAYGGMSGAEVPRDPGPAETAGAGLRYREWAGDIARTQLLFGWRTPGTLDPDTPALDLLAAVLGAGRASRLYRAVRERSLASSISVHNYTPRDLGVFAVHAETDPARTADAARAAWGQLAELRGAPAGSHELERARCVLESRWIRQLETMEGQAAHLAEWEALGSWTLAERYLERLLSVTADQVHDVARRYLVPDYAGVVVYRPRHAAPVADGPDAMRAVLDASTTDALAVSPPRTPSPLLATPAVAAALEQEIERVRVYRAPSGLPILVRRKPGAPVTHLGMFALGGATEEGRDHGGLTTLLARTALKGTAHRTATQIAEDAELLGGSIGASVGADGFGWTFSVPARYTEAAIELLADVVQHATIPVEAFETERTVALADLAMMRDDMYRYPLRLTTDAAFGAHPYGGSVLGSDESLRAITVGDVRTWHRRRVMEAAAVVAIVGDVDADLTAASAARAFAELLTAAPATIAPPVWPSTVVTRVEQRDKAQTALALAFPGPARLDPERYTAQLIAGVASGLGGRFFEELRDRQSLAYTVHAFPSTRRLAGTFVAYIATSPDREETARAGLLAEFQKLREGAVTAEELERAQRYAIGTHAIRQQSAGSVLGDIVDAWLHGRGLEELGEYEGRMRAVTLEMIRQLAEKYFDPERRVEGVVRGVGGGR
jgi:zinc protease